MNKNLSLFGHQLGREAYPPLKSFIASELVAAREEEYKVGVEHGENNVKFDAAMQREEGRAAGRKEFILAYKDNEEAFRLGFEDGRAEERQFILNVLDGIDAADTQMGLLSTTRTIRHALKTRVIQ